MQRPQPMNRLLQGDVGAGKTIVALLAALVAMENGLQVAFMAPTEILAEQHFLNIRRLLEPSRFRVGAADRRDAGAEAARAAGGARRRALSTWSSARTRSCRATSASARSGLVVIDEQHRFGVLQRADASREGAAPGRAGHDGHADSAHAGADGLRRSRRLGDPRHAAGPAARSRRSRSRNHGATRSTDFVRRQLDAGRQAYVIYPLVEESEKVDLKAATEMADHLAHDVFPADPRRAAARPDEAGRQGPRDARVRGGRDRSCWSRRRSSRSASTCRTRPS